MVIYLEEVAEIIKLLGREFKKQRGKKVKEILEAYKSYQAGKSKR